MVVLQSHLVDLFPPEKEEEDPDDAEVSKQLMADALSHGWSASWHHEQNCALPASSC
jgi:hypothetical protein